MLTFNYLKNNTKFKVLFGQKLKKKTNNKKTKAKTKCRSDLLPKSHFKNQQYQFKKHLNIYRIFKKIFPQKKENPHSLFFSSSKKDNCNTEIRHTCVMKFLSRL